MEKMNVIEAIKIAMDAESKARDFYADAVDKVTSERGKNLLKQLSDFENSHYTRLLDLKRSLEGDQGYIDYSGTDFNAFSPNAVSEVSGRIEKNKSNVLDILGMAIQSEDKAYERYVDLAAKIEDAKGKDMFLKFAEEEKSHRRILSDEFYYMNNKGGLWFWGD